MDEVENKKLSSKRKVLIVAVVVLSLMLVGAILVVAMQVGSAKKSVDSASESIMATLSVTSSATSTSTVSSTALATATKSASSADAAQANLAATNFMQAKKDRSLGAAKQYMTDQLYNNTDQVEFAGASSPSMSRFEITGNALKDAQTYQITVKTYWLLQNEDAGTINYTLEVMKLDNNFLVNRFDQN